MKIFPSILSADFSCLRDPLQQVCKGGTQQLHLDVMDGHFVPNISFGFPVIRSLTQAFPDIQWDAHLMIEEPEQYIDILLEIGVDWVSFHIEVDPPVEALSHQIRVEGASAGIALNPDTTVEEIIPHLSQVDYVLLMTVQPGFGGQSFQETVLEKIPPIREHFDGPIQVDGGIGMETISIAEEAGVDWFVAGSAIFGDNNPAEAVRDLERKAR